MSEKTTIEKLVDFIGAREPSLAEEWADGIMAIPGVRAIATLSRADYVQGMVDFLRLLRDHLQHPTDPALETFLQQLSARSYHHGLLAADMSRALRLLKRLLIRTLVEEFPGDRSELARACDALEDEIDEARFFVNQCYHFLTEERLRESEALARALLDHTEDAVFLIDGQTGEILQANSSAADLAGYERSELVGRNVEEFVRPDQIERAAQLLQQAQAEETVTVEDLLFQPREEEARPAWVRLTSLRYCNGRPAVQATIRDITRRHELESEIRERVRQLATLNDITKAINSSLDLGETLETIAYELQKLIPFDRASVALLEPDGEHLRFFHLAAREGLASHAGRIISKAETSLGLVLDSRRPLIRCGREGCSPDFPVDEEITAEGIRSHISLPLIYQGEPFGTFNLCSRDPEAYAEQDLQILEEVAGQLAIAIQNARLFAREHKRTQHLTVLNEVSTTAMSELNRKDLLRGVAQAISRRFDFYDVALFTVDQEAGEAVLQAHSGAYEVFLREGYRQKLETGIVGYVARTGKTHLANDVEQDDYYFKAFPEERVTRSELAVPIILEGQVIGVLDAQSHRRNAFDEIDVAAMETLGQQIAQALDRTRAYEEVRLLQQLSDAIIETMPSPLLVLDRSFRVRRANQGYYRIEGQHGEVKGKPIEEVFTSSFLKSGEVRKALETALATGESQIVEGVSHLCHGNRRRTVDVHITRLQAYGETELLLSINDVTEREKRLFQLTKLYEVSRSLQHILDLDRLMYEILTCVTAGPGFGFNRAALLLLNEEEDAFEERMRVGPRSAEEAGEIWARLGPVNDLLRLINREPRPEDGWQPGGAGPDRTSLRLPRGLECAALQAATEEQNPLKMPTARSNFEKCSACRDLNVCQALSEAPEWTIVPLVAEGRTVGLIIADNLFSGQPIDEESIQLLSVFASQAGLALDNARAHQRLEAAFDELRTTQEQLVEATRLAAVGEVAAHVAHEIRNPLVNIGGFANRILKRPEDREGNRQKAQIIFKEVLRLENILRDVMDFAAPGLQRLELTQLNDVVRSTCELLDMDVAGKSLHLSLDLHPDLPATRFDPSRIKQVVLNLMRNAIEASPEGGEIRITTWPENGRLGLAVRDNGPGIPAEQRPDLFKPFVTTKRGGSGLGLSATKKIIEDHGGAIEVDTEPGRGATFRVYLPLRGPEAE